MPTLEEDFSDIEMEESLTWVVGFEGIETGR